MDERKTVTIRGQEIALRKWPIRPAAKLGRAASRAFVEALGTFTLGKDDPFEGLAKAVEVLCDDKNAEIAVQMIALSLDVPERQEAFALAEEASWQDLAEVLAVNLVFRGSPLNPRTILSGLFTTPAPNSRDSVYPFSTPSTNSPATTPNGSSQPPAASAAKSS